MLCGKHIWVLMALSPQTQLLCQEGTRPLSSSLGILYLTQTQVLPRCSHL